MWRRSGFLNAAMVALAILASGTGLRNAQAANRWWDGGSSNIGSNGDGAKIDSVAGMTWSGAITPNSLLWTTSGGPQLAANSINVVNSGGILFSSAIGQNNQASLQGNGSDLVIIQNNNAAATKAPFISAIIANNAATSLGLTEAGPHQVELRGANTYTGPTLVQAGTL
jgi:hypothetical protein